MLEIEDLHVYYGEIHALKGISLRVAQGEIVALLGNNGAGKTTTLKTISGLLKPRQGRVLLEGRPIHQLPPHEIVARGTVITVDTPTHLSANLDFVDGATATLITSFDVWAHHLPCIEVHGTLGSISVPDPNGFGGAVQAWITTTRKWEDVPLVPIRAENSRCIGVNG